MENDVIYMNLGISAKKKQSLYNTVKVTPRKNMPTSSRQEQESQQGPSSLSLCCHKVTIILLGIAVFALLGTVLYLSLKCAVCELCPPGWQLSNSRCYYFSGECRSWDTSERDCTDKKSHLLVLEDEAEADWISKMRPKDEYFWIGYKYNITQEQWMWLDNTGFSGYSVKVDKNAKEKKCAAFKVTDVLSPDFCQSTHSWICKRHVTVLEL
ncbi:killer cell lectin-like receptor subfamily F member 1 isoform X2 [Ornithorhynchus anatinus]|uniref:C-type lectin domain-containing protein n=1 Tax=Ornithorhynchus anatinus TaxID=9258 RepID=F6RJN9_ORNAN|nr:killer cell lectin-like receptor subfamily F member 1 isoform X2 [Ornithorhynchus anatinus]